MKKILKGHGAENVELMTRTFFNNQLHFMLFLAFSKFQMILTYKC